MLAALRADIHNTSSRQFEHLFQAADFLPGGAPIGLEERVAALVATGKYTPSQAAAIASSKKPMERRIHLVSDAVIQSKQAKQPRRRREK